MAVMLALAVKQATVRHAQGEWTVQQQVAMVRQFHAWGGGVNLTVQFQLFRQKQPRWACNCATGGSAARGYKGCGAETGSYAVLGNAACRA